MVYEVEVLLYHHLDEGCTNDDKYECIWINQNYTTLISQNCKKISYSKFFLYKQYQELIHE